MKNIFNIIRFVLGLSLLIVLMSFSHYKIGEQLCEIKSIDIQVDENKFVTLDLITQLLNENSVHPNDKKLVTVSVNKIESILENHSSIKTANVFSDLKGNISIYVSSRVPIVRIQNKKEGYYIDSDGDKMPFSNLYTSRILLITGNIDEVENKDLFTISDYIYNDDFLRKQIVQINIEKSELTLYTRVGEYIEFGEVKNIYTKFNNLRLYYDKGTKENSIYKTISLKYNNQIVCTKK